MRAIPLLLGLTVSALAGCTEPTRRPIPPFRWQVIPMASSECSCPTAREMFVINRGPGEATLSYTEYRNYTHEDRVDTENKGPFTMIAGAVGRKSLGCSVRQDDNGQCRVTVQWKIEDRIFDGSSYLESPTYNQAAPAKAKLVELERAATAKGISSEERLAAERTRVVEGGKQLWTPRQDCVAVCANISSPECVKGSLGKPGDDPTPQFVKLVKDAGNKGVVPVAKLLEVLHQHSNPCDRTDLSVDNGLLTNSGAACSWKQAQSQGMQVEVRIPENVTGQVSYPAGRMRVDFLKPDLLAPTLHFTAADLDGKFGGPVARAEQAKLVVGGAERNFMVLTGRTHCIALRAD